MERIRQIVTETRQVIWPGAREMAGEAMVLMLMLVALGLLGLGAHGLVGLLG